MEGKIKKIITIVVILIAIFLSLIAFLGWHVQENGIWKNKIPDLNLGMELGGFRELRFVLDDTEEEKEIYLDENGNYAGDVVEETTTQPEISLENPTTGEITETTTEELTGETEAETEEVVEDELAGYTKETRTIKVNPDERLTKANFQKAKSIIQKRLETINLHEFNIRLDEITGELVVEVPDDNNLQLSENLITTPGNIVISDSETGIILIDDSMVKKVYVLGSTETGVYQSYFEIEFNKEGAQKLQEIAQKYIKFTNENGDEETKAVSITVDGSKLIDLYFDPEIPVNNTIQIPVGQAYDDYNTYLQYASSLNSTVAALNTETMPLVYQLASDNLIKSEITEKMMNIAKIAFAIAIAIVSIVMIVKYKANGLKYAIIAVGYIAVLVLIMKYTNIKVTINAVIAFISVIVINYIFNFKLLNKLGEDINKKEALKETLKEMYLTAIPLCIISVIFTFMSSVVISSIGMIIFWGLLIQALLSLLVLI